MNTKFIFASTVAALLFTAVSCSYDDTELKNKVDDLDKRLTELEQTVKSINDNVGSLMTIVNALEKEVKIDKVVNLEDGSGHVIMFTDGSSITVTNGKDGADGDNGETPVISVGKDADGIYYWKVNGEWLLDDGNKIPATSKTEIPQIRVNETTGNFELSFDGENWQDIGSAGGAGIFKDVIDGEDEVIFILSGNKEPIVIPKAQKFALNVENTSIPVDAPGSSIMVSYTVTAADQGTTVEAIAIGGIVIEGITSQIIGNEIKGQVSIQLPNPIPADGKVFLFAVNSKGTPSMRILSFEQGEINVEVKGALSFEAIGGTLELFVSTNYNYGIEVPEWITYEKMVLTRAVRNEFITMTIAENKDATERRATISFVDGITVRYSLTVTQKGAEVDIPGYKGTIEDWKDDGSIDF